MSISVRTKKFVREFFERYPLPKEFKWCVYTTNSHKRGFIVSNKLIVFAGEQPVNYVAARKRADCIVVNLPLHPGTKHSPGVEVACKAAILKLVERGNLDV